MSHPENNPAPGDKNLGGKRTGRSGMPASKGLNTYVPFGS